MTSLVENEKIARIKKLLRLSTSTNSNEADIALAKAQALATEAGIDLAVAAVNLDSIEVKEEFVKEQIDQGKRKNVCQKYVSWIIGNHFNVSIVYNGTRYSGQRINFIGRKSDVELAIYVNGFLNSEFMRRWHEFKNNNNLGCKERNSYLYGLYEGLSEKLSAAKKQAEDARFNNIAAMSGDKILATPVGYERDTSFDNPSFVNQVKEKYYLMIKTEVEERQEVVATYYPKLRTDNSNTNLTGSINSRDAGRSHGRDININRPIGSQLVLN